MGHYETRIETRERPEIRAAITRCQNLMLTLGRLEARGVEHKNSADNAVDACKTIAMEECDNFSGVYYEDHYIPYRETFFGDIKTVSDGCATMLTQIRDRINTLSSKISSLQGELYEDVEVSYWVEDDLEGAG
jgi:hypothetical protein